MDDIDEQVQAAIDSMKYDIEQIAIACTLEVLAELREATPVDTRHAAANWVPSRGAPWLEVDGDVTPSRYERKGGVETKVKQGGTTAGAAQQAGEADVFAYRLSDGDLYVSNNVPYMVGPGSLNDGHSKQAPAGFIESAIERAMLTMDGLYGVGSGGIEVATT